MAVAKYIIGGGIALVILFLLGQNVCSLKVVCLQKELLRSHFTRLEMANEKNQVLITNGAKIIKTYKYYADKYLDAEGNLKPEFIYVPLVSSDIIVSLEQEHKREERLNERLTDLFTHTELFDRIHLIKKSIIDGRVHLGEYRSLHKTGYYEVFINHVPHPFSYDHKYTLPCADTFDLEIKKYTINDQGNGIDTTIFKEQLIVSNL